MRGQRAGLSPTFPITYKRPLEEGSGPVRITYWDFTRLKVSITYVSSCLVKAACANSSSEKTMAEFEGTVQQVVRYMNLRPLKPKQVEALCRFVSGRDTFVALQLEMENQLFLLFFLFCLIYYWVCVVCSYMIYFCYQVYRIL